MSAPSMATVALTSWADLVAKVKAGDSAGMAELYSVFSRGMRLSFCRRFGSQDLDDKVHDLFLTVVGAIQSGKLRQPERLMGFVRTVMQRHAASYIASAVAARSRFSSYDELLSLPDRQQDHERLLIENESQAIAIGMLKSLPSREREILDRFYLRGQDQAQICGDMRLTETQFRLMKSRAKSRYGQKGEAPDRASRSPRVKLPSYPWRKTRARTERLQEQELERLASQIPDQDTLDQILADYPEMQRVRVLARIRQFLKFETEQAV